MNLNLQSITYIYTTNALISYTETQDIHEDVRVIQGDCLELLKTLPDNSVHLVLCDLPYGM